MAGSYATSYRYDGAGQPIQRTTPVASGQSITETWGYDALGELTRYTDGRNNSTWQTYNTLGLPEDAIEPAAGPHTTEAQRRWRSIYDANGNVTSQRSPGGVTVTSDYDELNRLVSQAGSGAQAPPRDAEPLLGIASRQPGVGRGPNSSGLDRRSPPSAARSELRMAAQSTAKPSTKEPAGPDRAPCSPWSAQITGRIQLVDPLDIGAYAGASELGAAISPRGVDRPVLASDLLVLDATMVG